MRKKAKGTKSQGQKNRI